MASLIKKKKGNRLYYYLVESARVDGKPRIVHQAYLGTAEKVAELIEQKSAPVPLSATLRNFGLPGALWLAAKQSGVWPLLESLWSAPRSGPAPAHYLLPSSLPSGVSLPSVLPRKPSGTPSNRFFRSPVRL